MTLKKVVVAFVVFYVLIILVTTIWNGFLEGYEIQEENTQNGINIFQRLSQLNLLAGINDLTIGIQKLTNFVNGGGDILGALAAGATGLLQIIGGIVTFPIEIGAIIFGYYPNLIPPIISQFIGILTVLAVAFVLISARLGYEL